MKADGFSFGQVTQTSSGSNSANQVGANEFKNVTAASEPVTVNQFFQAIRESLPEPVAQQIASEVVAPIEQLATSPPIEPGTLEEQHGRATLMERLKPYGPRIVKAVAIFGEGALNALASSNPIIAGVLALCRASASQSI